MNHSSESCPYVGIKIYKICFSAEEMIESFKEIKIKPKIIIFPFWRMVL